MITIDPAPSSTNHGLSTSGLSRFLNRARKIVGLKGEVDVLLADDSTLRQLWSGPRRIFLFTYNPTQRQHELAPYGPVHILASAGGKTILTNR